MYEDLHLPIAIRKPHRKNIPEPGYFSDDKPEPPACLPPEATVESQAAPDHVLGSDNTPLQRSSLHTCLSKVGRRVLKSPRNLFGLYRRFFGDKFPSHDPDTELSTHDLSDVIVNDETIGLPAPALEGTGRYGPYPNHSAFALGEWFWNNGAQKSKSDFKHLVGIITDPAFRPEDVQGLNWDRIDQQLGDSGSDADWIDEPDAGWTRTPVTIQVPFPYKINRRDRNRPAPLHLQDFVVPDFYHRSIVSILKERLSSKEAQHFHMEPYELRWQANEKSKSTRVHGEIYTSPAFIEAHHALQESAGEPGCDLPRVVVALMFSSDATQLTSFGQARVWPLYMNFGNDSKYRRSKPSLHLCDHVAYFQKVMSFTYVLHALLMINSSQAVSKILSRCMPERNVHRGYSWSIVTVNLSMPSGKLFLMKNSWMHTNMELSFKAQMACIVDSTCGFLHILQTIQKSKSQFTIH